MIRLLPILVLTLVAAAAAVPDLPHPRLLFPAARTAEVKERVASDPVLAGFWRTHRERATEILDERTCRYEIPDGKRLLFESRRALENVLFTAMTWRLEGAPEFRERAIAELDAAAGLKDWNPSHFLDVAEMATAVAIGYDWLYDTLDEEQRRRYENALVEKALKPMQEKRDGEGGWNLPDNNWRQVCGAGIGLACLAVWEREPEMCEELYQACREMVAACDRFYRPDGCYPEGPAYWHFGTNYHVLILAACEGVGDPMEAEPALERSGAFILQTVGPTGLDYNFADSRQSEADLTPAQAWIARHFDNAPQAAAVRDVVGDDPQRAAESRFAPLHLIWMPRAPEGEAPELPRFDRFEGDQPMAFFRTAWQPDAGWLAIKGGTGAVSHGHLDAGSFVYESDGVRWFIDLGMENYNLPGYFGGKRWDYYRLNNFSHNTLVIDGRLQAAPRDPCVIIDSGADGDVRWVEIDLSKAYPGQAESVIRRAEFNMETGAVSLTDRLDKPVGPVRWSVFTDTETMISDGKVKLSSGAASLELLRADGDGEWEITDAAPPTEAENPNEGVKRIGFEVPTADKLEIRVNWTPSAGG